MHHCQCHGGAVWPEGNEWAQQQEVLIREPCTGRRDLGFIFVSLLEKWGHTICTAYLTGLLWVFNKKNECQSIYIFLKTMKATQINIAIARS